MFLILFFVLLVMWLLGFAAFHVAGGLIHLVLIIAFISLVAHLSSPVLILSSHSKKANCCVAFSSRTAN